MVSAWELLLIWCKVEKSEGVLGEGLRRVHNAENQWLYQGLAVVPRGHLAIPGDIFGHHTWERGRYCHLGVWWVEARGAARHHTSALAEKPGSTAMTDRCVGHLLCTTSHSYSSNSCSAWTAGASAFSKDLASGRPLTSPAPCSRASLKGTGNPFQHSPGQLTHWVSGAWKLVNTLFLLLSPGWKVMKYIS